MPEKSKKRKKLSEMVLAWRAKQKPGAIMKPSTFEEIKRKAAAEGATSPTKVAGKAYWRTVEAKYRERLKKKKKV